jgi:hypothetical protein
VDLWIAPPACWRTLSRIPVQPGAPGTLPPLWRGRIETSGSAFSALTLILSLLAGLAGTRLQRRIPLRACSNCGRTVCRRCAERRRERALCPVCAAIDSRAESPEFARVLLLQHRRRVMRRQGLLRTALATLLPGYGLLASRHVVPAVAMLSAFAALATAAVGQAMPFASEPRLLLPSVEIPTPVFVGAWVTLYVLSLCGYLAQESRERARLALLAAPVRSRTAQPTRSAPAAA